MKKIILALLWRCEKLINSLRLNQSETSLPPPGSDAGIKDNWNAIGASKSASPIGTGFVMLTTLLIAAGIYYLYLEPQYKRMTSQEYYFLLFFDILSY